MPSSIPSLSTPPIALLLLLSLPTPILTQNRTITSCTPSLLPLTPCAPFAQGMVPIPAQQCCDNLVQLYSQQRQCICLLLDNTTLNTLPVNRTLALQLPTLCNLQLSVSACPGLPLPTPPTSTRSQAPPVSSHSQLSPALPRSQVSHGTSRGSTFAASPMVPVAPRPSMIGLGLRNSSGIAIEMNFVSSFVVSVLLMLLTAIRY